MIMILLMIFWKIDVAPRIRSKIKSMSKTALASLVQILECGLACAPR